MTELKPEITGKRKKQPTENKKDTKISVKWYLFRMSCPIFRGSGYLMIYNTCWPIRMHFLRFGPLQGSQPVPKHWYIYRQWKRFQLPV